MIAAAPEAEVTIDCQWDALDLTVSARMGGGSWQGVGAFWTPYFAPTPERASLEMDRWEPRTVAHFLRSIGEDVPEEDEEVVAGRWKAAVSKQRRQQELAALAKSALSPATADLLGSLTLPVKAGRPYALWEHTHEFSSHTAGVLVADRVRYALPFGALGRAAHALAVRAALAAIFDFRYEQIGALLGADRGCNGRSGDRNDKRGLGGPIGKCSVN